MHSAQQQLNNSLELQLQNSKQDLFDPLEKTLELKFNQYLLSFPLLSSLINNFVFLQDFQEDQVKKHSSTILRLFKESQKEQKIYHIINNKQIKKQIMFHHIKNIQINYQAFTQTQFTLYINQFLRINKSDQSTIKLNKQQINNYLCSIFPSQYYLSINQ
ncbi:hypothetical protein ABPG74_019759 [Tetrahymena malaccensis]